MAGWQTINFILWRRMRVNRVQCCTPKNDNFKRFESCLYFCHHLLTITNQAVFYLRVNFFHRKKKKNTLLLCLMKRSFCGQLVLSNTTAIFFSQSSVFNYQQKNRKNGRKIQPSISLKVNFSFQTFLRPTQLFERCAKLIKVFKNLQKYFHYSKLLPQNINNIFLCQINLS